jgi:A/G-specific adenine glycosylase
MLQQMQVDRVLPKYEEWLKISVARCARRSAGGRRRRDVAAPGYNIRPKRLQNIAREVVANYGSELPADEETLLSFGASAPIPPAPSAASFRERAAILDTNGAVLFRVFAKGDPKSHAMKQHL